MIYKHTDFEVPGFGELEHTPITTPSYREALLSLSPSAYWSLGETTGTVLADATAKHPLTLSGDYVLGRPPASDAAEDGAMRFNDARASAPGPVLPTTPWAALSIVGWVRRTTPGTTGRVLGQYNGTAPGRMVVLILADGRLLLSVAGDSYAVSTAAPIDSWTHIVLTRDSYGNARWYLNGQPDTTTTGQTTAIADVPFALGKQLPETFGHELDEFAIFPTPLSPAQVAWLYQLATHRPAPLLGAH